MRMTMSALDQELAFLSGKYNKGNWKQKTK